MNLAERFSRGAIQLKKLFIGNVRETRQETRSVLAIMVQKMISGENTPSKLGLFNLGFEAQEGEAIIQTIIEK